MDNCEKFDETTIKPKEDFYSNLNEEVISDADYVHAQKVWEVFGITNRGKYHNLYVLCDTLLLADALEKSVLKYMKLVLHILCPHRDKHGNHT